MGQQSFEFFHDRLGRALSYFGSKYSIAHLYPAPVYDHVVEPFAGGASYSLLHYRKQVTLVDLNSDVVRAWQCLIKRTPAEILDIPLLSGVVRVSELNLPVDVKSLLGFWLRSGIGAKCHVYTDQNTKWPSPWSRSVRDSLARVAGQVKHWEVKHGSYEAAGDMEATWFIDPPYYGSESGSYKHYRVEYDSLAEWVRSRRGQAIACDRSSATWLPFKPLCKYNGMRKQYFEGIWTNSLRANAPAPAR